MIARLLRVRLLTARAFAAFGEVIGTRAAKSYLINGGTTRRYHDLARIDVAARGGRPLLNIFRAQPATLPLEINALERHPLGSQAFIPLERRTFLIVVAENGRGGVPERVQAFISDAGLGVNYRRGVWHHPLIALEQVSDFVVIDRHGRGANCDTLALDYACVIQSLPRRRPPLREC